MGLFFQAQNEESLAPSLQQLFITLCSRSMSVPFALLIKLSDLFLFGSQSKFSECCYQLSLLFQQILLVFYLKILTNISFSQMNSPETDLFHCSYLDRRTLPALILRVWWWFFFLVFFFQKDRRLELLPLILKSLKSLFSLYLLTLFKI